jgi:hypothetical protein
VLFHQNDAKVNTVLIFIMRIVVSVEIGAVRAIQARWSTRICGSLRRGMGRYIARRYIFCSMDGGFLPGKKSARRELTTVSPVEAVDAIQSIV